MPKGKISHTIRVKSYISEYSENILSSGGNILFCKICDVKVTCKKQFTVVYFKKNKHICGIE